jgi:hypothetical protein
MWRRQFSFSSSFRCICTFQNYFYFQTNFEIYPCGTGRVAEVVRRSCRSVEDVEVPWPQLRQRGPPGRRPAGRAHRDCLQVRGELWRLPGTSAVRRPANIFSCTQGYLIKSASKINHELKVLGTSASQVLVNDKNNLKMTKAKFLLSWSCLCFISVCHNSFSQFPFYS